MSFELREMDYMRLVLSICGSLKFLSLQQSGQMLVAAGETHEILVKTRNKDTERVKPRRRSYKWPWMKPKEKERSKCIMTLKGSNVYSQG
jgi:hypothetical protein